MSTTGSGILTVSWKFFNYWLKSRHRRAYGIHSPYVFDFLLNAVARKSDDEKLKSLFAYHKSLSKRKDKICIDDHGAGSRFTNEGCRSIASLAGKSSAKKKYAALLYRICKWYKPTMIIEFGTGIGISTRYLSMGAPGVRVFTMEGSEEKYAFAKTEAERDGFADIDFYVGHFDKFLPGLSDLLSEKTLVFIDGDHRYEPTVEKVNVLLEKGGPEEIIIILDDIYWSTGMEKAWEEVSADQRVSLSMDFFQFGILVKRPGFEKQDFRIKF